MCTIWPTQLEHLSAVN